MAEEKEKLAKLKALQLTLDKLDKTYGKGSVMKMGDVAQEDIEVIPSGSLGLDMALGVGGYPKGRVIEIYGPESSGKTTLALHAMAEAQKQGGIAGTYFWVGSETAFDGITPRYWYRYDGSVPGNDRVDQALTWLDMPDEDRPMFISLYFSEVDDAGHRYGPRADETAAALSNVDGYIGRLIDGCLLYTSDAADD